MNDFGASILAAVICIALGMFVGLLVGSNISPTMSDVVTLDNKRCILIYEQDLVHKFCEAE